MSHARVSCRCCAYLASPAHSDNTPFLNLASSLGLNILDHARDGRNSLGGSTGALEESAELGTLLGGVRGEIGSGVGLAVEEVGDVDLETGTSEEVGTLFDNVSD